MIDVVLEDERWAGLEELAIAATEATLAHFALDPVSHLVCVMGCDDQRIAELNAQFREKPTATNVLSWPAQKLVPPQTPTPDAFEDETELGDIALAYETCHREAGEARLKPQAHIAHLIVHGTLHLLGYDHIEDTDAELMEGLEVEILAKLGFPNPY
jgi:probable rRNA maturation factor